MSKSEKEDMTGGEKEVLQLSGGQTDRRENKR